MVIHVAVAFTPGAEDDLVRLDRALKRLRWLAEHFEQVTPQTLSGPWQGVYKLRVGDYRVLYTCDHEGQTIIGHFIRHRREIYRR